MRSRLRLEGGCPSDRHCVLGARHISAFQICGACTQAMGLKPKSRPVAKPKQDALEIADLMRKARGNDMEGAAEPPAEAADHMPGLGFHAGSAAAPSQMCLGTLSMHEAPVYMQQSSGCLRHH